MLMVPLADMFSRLRAAREKALVLFVTAGDPSLEDLPDILSTLAENGADAIEIGLPFSDPIADGPTIQASSQRALDRGTTTEQIFDALRGCSVPVPIILMGYYNTVLRRGLDQFAREARDAGASGAIISDLTPEEAQGWTEAAQACNIDTILLAAPTSTDRRLRMVAEQSRGFIYAVSRTGVTGAAESDQPDVARMVLQLRQTTSTPICIGFGIRTPEQVRAASAHGDGAVIGSALVELLSGGWNPQVRAEVAAHVRDWKAATRS